MFLKVSGRKKQGKRNRRAFIQSYLFLHTKHFSSLEDVEGKQKLWLIRSTRKICTDQRSWYHCGDVKDCFLCVCPSGSERKEKGLIKITSDFQGRKAQIALWLKWSDLKQHTWNSLATDQQIVHIFTI